MPHAPQHSRPGFDDYFMGIALAVRRRANCLGSQVGAIIVVDRRIVSSGYNGTAEGMANCTDGGCDRCAHRDQYPKGTGYDLCICVHAEQNAVLAAARFGIPVAGGTVYTTLQPCFGCLKEMIQAKIRRVCYLDPWAHPDKRLATEYKKLAAHLPDRMVHLAAPATEGVWTWKSRS